MTNENKATRATPPERYRDLTDNLAREQLGTAGWPAPACGGPKLKDLTQSQKAIAHEVRLIISRGLGHEREQITAIYVGR